MKRLGAVLVGALVAVLLAQSLAQGAPAAKKTANIPIPSDGNAAVAHLVLTAKPKKGKKPKRAVKRPRLKVKKAPKGVAVVAASYKRDAKVKNRWHATVALTNPFTKKTLRAASSASDPGDDGIVIVEVIETDTEFIWVITLVQIEQDTTFAEMPVPPWMNPFCDPPGSGGDIYLFGPPPDGVSPSDFVRYGCILGMDGPAEFDEYDELDLSGLMFDLDPYPGNPLEYYIRFQGVNVDPFNGVAITAPAGHTVTALLPPPGGYGATKSGTTATFGKQNQPFVPGTVYRANVRYDNILTLTDILMGRITMNFGGSYSDPFAGHYTP